MTPEITQNRITIFASDHPIASRWWWSGAERNSRFPPRSRFDSIWRSADPASTTNGNPMIGRSNGAFVRSAIVASAMPSEVAPVSPMKNRAGGILNQRNASMLPMSTPMNAAQAGAQNTRSMHPKTVALCEALFRGTLDGPISLEQPYFFLTKGELCRAAGDALQDLAVKSITCDGGGQHQPLSGAHCGFCTSCLYRRSSLHAALRGRDPTPYRAPPKSRNSGYPVFAFENQSIELSRAALSWPDLLAYDSNIRHAVARFAQVGVRTQAEVQTALCDLFRRHAGEALACLREDPPLRVRAPSTVGAAS